MPEFSERGCKRIADVVRQVEGEPGRFPMMHTAKGVINTPELRAVRITSVTLDSDGLYPAQLIEADADADPSAWTDTTECRVQALSGDLAVGRLWAARVGETAAGLPIFSPAGGNSTSTKRYVRAATTANITLSGTQTIDGVSIAVGEDVLVKNQSTTANNGIYTAASSTWTRRADADSWDELVGALVVVTEGTTLADTLWMCTSNAGGTLGSTAVTWSQVAADGVSAIVRVRLATTAQITLASDLENGDTIDGVVLATGDRVLVKDQTIGPSSNGVYVVASSGAPSRATDMDTWDELITPQVYVEAGTVNMGSLWWCMEDTGGTIDSTTVRWRSGIKAGTVDGTPAYSGVVSLLFDETDGFLLSQTATGAVQVDISPCSGGGYGVIRDVYQHSFATTSAVSIFYTNIDIDSGYGGDGSLSIDGLVVLKAPHPSPTISTTTLLGCDEELLFVIGPTQAVEDGPVYNSYRFGPGYTSGTVDYKVFIQTAKVGAESDYTAGMTATVSGLSFLHGWYTGGSLTVTVSAGDVTGLDEAIDDRVAALLVAGTGIGLSYNDGAGTLTISCTITQYTDEMARDALGTALTAGTGIAITPNDGADTITVALSFLGLEALTDPGADRILFWDDSAGAFAWLTAGSGLSISGTTLTATGSITGPGSSTDNAIVRWDGTGGTAIQNSTALIADDGSMDVNSTIAATNSTDEILHLHQACSGGTPTAGFGTVIQVHLANDGSSDVKAMTWTTTWVDATHASRKSRVIWHINDTASREIMRGEASGSAPMVGFLGANAAIRQTGDVGTAMVTFGLMSGTPTFAWGNLSSVPTASDTASGIVELAVQSEMETATDTSRAVVPGRVQYHPGVCKGWVHFSATGGTVTSLASHNVSSITDGGVGNYTINWNTDFSGADYAVVGTASYLDGTATDVIVETHISFAAGSAQVYTLSYDAGTLVDTTRISIVAFGDQA